MLNIDIIVLNSGNNLILGHKPSKLSLDQVGQKMETNKSFELEKFGLFDVAAPNFQTFYPEVKPEDLNPKPEDLIHPIFRALSKTVVHPQFNPIDFSKGSVLKDSMGLLVGQAIFANHEPKVGNEIGVVSNVSFQNKSSTTAGIDIPAGINAELQIDGKSHPTIARGILMTPPSIHSTSVTVEFEWEPSHPKLERSEFYNKLGEFDAEGNLIRRIVTKIRRYHEISLVAHGADPYAQQIRDGKIINPVYANNGSVKLSAEEKQKSRIYFFNYKTDLVNLSTDSTILDIPNNKPINYKTSSMKLLIAKLTKLHADGILKLGAGVEITEENALEIVGISCKALQETNNKLTEKETKVTELTASLTEANNKVTEKETKITELNTKVAALTAEAAIGKTSLESTRNEVIRLHGILNPEGDEAMLNLIKGADFNGLTSFAKQFTKQVEEKYPGECKDCGSHNVSRMSAANPKTGITESNADDEKDKNKNKKEKSNDEVTRELSSMNFGSANKVHGTEIKEKPAEK